MKILWEEIFVVQGKMTSDVFIVRTSIFIICFNPDCRSTYEFPKGYLGDISAQEDLQIFLGFSLTAKGDPPLQIHE